MLKNFKQIHEFIENVNLPVQINYPILFINLNKSIHRREFMEHQFNKYGLKATRIEAVDGNHLDTIKFINEYTNLDNYEIGCLLSHLLSIKYAYDNNFNNVL